jgi:hypothetical protein
MRSIHTSQANKRKVEHIPVLSMTAHRRFRDLTTLRKIQTESRPSAVETLE